MLKEETVGMGQNALRGENRRKKRGQCFRSRTADHPGGTGKGVREIFRAACYRGENERRGLLGIETSLRHKSYWKSSFEQLGK